MLDSLMNIGLLLLILGTSAWATNAYARGMYNRCGGCGSLNAKRRTHCRECGSEISIP